MMVKMVTILIGDCLDVLKTLPDCSVHCCVTSPPYWGLRDYGVEGQFGMERTPEEYVAKMTAVFHEVRRVLRDDGTLWLNLGSSYAATTKGSSGVGKNGSNKGTLIIDRRWQVPPGFKPKDLIGIPWLVAFALQADGWYLRQDIIWSKPNPMPESVRDRCTKAHEYVFLLSKSSRYYYDAEAVKEESVYPDDNRKERQKPEDYAAMMGDSGQLRAVINPSDARTYPYRNRRSVWTITPKPYRGAHFAVMPPDLAELCILAGTSKRGCCPACGKPWERVVDKANPKGRRDRGGPNDGPRDAGIWSGRAGTREYTTVGWQPGCKCSAGLPVPCTVLDPFGGSGTTGYIASRNGCRAVMIELNPKYAKLAHDRCG
jgi:DNA modification methylase